MVGGGHINKTLAWPVQGIIRVHWDCKPAIVDALRTLIEDDKRVGGAGSPHIAQFKVIEIRLTSQFLAKPAIEGDAATRWHTFVGLNVGASPFVAWTSIN